MIAARGERQYAVHARLPYFELRVQSVVGADERGWREEQRKGSEAAPARGGAEPLDTIELSNTRDGGYGHGQAKPDDACGAARGG
jgi:hypothetical protein